jgi:hypothetical protein
MKRSVTLLARVIQAYLDIAWFLVLIAGGFLFVATPFVIVGAPRIEDSDIKVAVRFTMDQSALAGSVPRSDDLVPARVQGQGVLQVKSTSRALWAGFLYSSLAVMGAWWIVLHQLRKLFRSVSGGSPFDPANARRIRAVGVVVVAWQLVVPLAKYFMGRTLVGELTIRGVTLKPPIDFNLDALFLGMAIFVLAEVFREASDLQREQSLTV